MGIPVGQPLHQNVEQQSPLLLGLRVLKATACPQ
jgi:hypothetical protein